MDTETILQGIANYGFPIVVSWYLLSRMETKLDALSKNIDALSHTIDSLMR